MLPKDRRIQLLWPVRCSTANGEWGMKKLCFALTLALGGAFVLPPDPADARPRHHHVGKHHHVSKKKLSHQRKSHHRKTVSHRKSGAGHSVSLAGVTPVLAAKARQIASTCGSVIISGVSRRARRSNHPIGRAVDMRGNPQCIYAQLKNWPGGYSTDYSAARHVHISYNPGGQEWGLRFAHGGTRKSYARRYAHNHSRVTSATQFAYSSSRKKRTSSRKTHGIRYARTGMSRYARAGMSRYAMQPVLFAPAKHRVY
jgi:hypothetical protein